MSISLFRRGPNRPRKPLTPQSQASAWDVVVLSFKLLFQRIQFWIQPNFWTVVFSLGLVTAPAAKAAMHHTVALGLRDPGDSAAIRPFKEMQSGFKYYFWRALLLSLIKWLAFGVIAVSIYFWVTQESWGARAVSIVSFYGLVLWWISAGYIHPILVENPRQPIDKILKAALLLGLRKPFQSLLFAVVSTLLMVLGTALLGPVMLIVPVARAILMLQGYWFLVGWQVPGFLEIHEYVNLQEKINE